MSGLTTWLEKILGFGRKEHTVGEGAGEDSDSHTKKQASSGTTAVSFGQIFNGFDLKKIFESPKRILIISVVVGVVALSVIVPVIIHAVNDGFSNNQIVQKKSTQAVLNQLGSIHDEVQNLESSPQNASAMKEQLKKIDGELNDVNSSVSGMKDDMDAQISDLKKAVSANPNDRQYLDPKDLPFKVISVDVIANQPYAEVNVDDHLQPMAIGDSMAGWILTDADYETSSAIFKNVKDQYIKVIVQGV